MQKFSLELPKGRLELQWKLVKRREPLVSDPFLPTPGVVKKKYHSGSFLGKALRHLSEHKSTKKFIAANLSAFVIAGTLIPGVGVQSPTSPLLQGKAEEAIIQTQNNLKTEKAIQYPLATIKVNQGFSAFHPGVDLGAEVGEPIKPVKAGEVTEAGYATDGYGNTVLIDHGEGLTSRYAHLSKIEVIGGEKVTTDTEIGKVGVSGHTTGPHLHLEIRQDGAALNPLYILPR